MMKTRVSKLAACVVALCFMAAACKGKATAGPDLPTAEAVATSHFEASADSLYAFVERQVNLGARAPGEKAHSECARLIEELLSNYGVDTVLLEDFTTTDHLGTPLQGRNIVGRINASAPQRTLLLAHYDTRPWADNDPDEANHTRPVPGANDGASGVAVLLEVARLTARHAPDSVGVDLLFVDLEDCGSSEGGDTESTWCLGTQEWVKNMPYAKTELPRQAILFDMVGGRNALFHQEYISAREAPGLMNRFWDTARRSGYAHRFPRQIGGAVVDDHLFINRAGIPCIDVIECRNEYTGSFNPTWHTVDDNLRNIDPATLQMVTQTTLNFLFPAYCPPQTGTPRQSIPKHNINQ